MLARRVPDLLRRGACMHACAASSAAQALLLLLPQWRLGVVLQYWQEADATRRILTSVLSALPPCDYHAWAQVHSQRTAPSSASSAGGRCPSQGTFTACPGTGSASGLPAAAAAAAGTAAKAVPMLQLLLRIVIASGHRRDALVHSMLLDPDVACR